MCRWRNISAVIAFGAFLIVSLAGSGVSCEPIPESTSPPATEPTTTITPVPTTVEQRSDAIIIDHQCTDISKIPSQWIDQAKSNLRVLYFHTSHGSQITTGMENLQSHYGTTYDFNEAGSGGALSYQEVSADLGHNGDLTWENETRNQLNQPDNDRNVVIWAWCGGVSDNTEEGIDIYLNAMNQLEIDYPDVTFIYMTGHLDGTGESGNLNVRNNQIRSYCIDNNKILFDFADIESYDPDGNYFLDLNADDNCDYDGGNWAQEWSAANPDSDLSDPCEECAHSQDLNCNLKARAFWWMMARIAGGAAAMKGDSDADGDIDFYDFVAFAAAYGSVLGDANYNVIGDFDADGDIDIFDFVAFAEVYGYGT